MVRPPNVKALVERNPNQAFATLAPKLSKAARTENPAVAEEIVAALARHGDTLPAAWRKLLVEMADEKPLALSAAVGLAQVKPHPSMVPAMIRRVAAKFDRCAAAKDDLGRSWDDEIGLAVLAKCADPRAAAVLERLLVAPRVAHWDLLLEACAVSGSTQLIPALTRWLATAKRKGVDPKWDGFVEGRRVLKDLKSNLP